MADETLKAGKARLQTLDQAREHLGAVIKKNKPMCGPADKALANYLFPDHGDHVGSMALAPLVYGTTFGVLAIGNRDPHYYRTSMGTLFLSYIGEVLNRTLPKYLPR